MAQFKRSLICLWPVMALAPIPAAAQQSVNDTLTGTSSSYKWVSLNGACLTAGDGTGPIPACVGLQYYSGKTLVGGVSGRLPDPVGQGALRLTNGDTTTGSNGNSQSGAVVSDFTFPATQGVQITFTTVTYGGNAYGNSAGQKSGADGIAFFLMDGTDSSVGTDYTVLDQQGKATLDAQGNKIKTPNLGSVGGSLGYSCSNGNGPYNGVVGGYIGVGIDEYGNFSNKGDNTSSGTGASPGQVALRGAGSVSWYWLNKTYPNLYPNSVSDSDRTAAVQNTCASGVLYNYSGRTITDTNGRSVSNKGKTVQAVLNYPFLASNSLTGTTIYNQEATATPTRGKASPITYTLNITQAGYLNLSYSVNGGSSNAVITNRLITADNGPLPSQIRFGFSAGTGGGSNVHEITCFKAAQIGTSSSSAGTNVQQSARVEAGTQVYLAYYHPDNWWGQLTAQSLLYNASTDTVTLSTTANWDASCVLTGGTCSPTGNNTTAQAPSDRSLLTWSGSQGTALAWDSLTTAQKTALTTGDATANSSRLDYLRGDRSNELADDGSGLYRARKGVLGDIVNSSPTWVGAPALPYTGTWKDALYPTATMPESDYATFASTNATRMNVVYAGSNDGLLHGFRAGGYDANGDFTTATYANDGREVIGFMPNTVLSTIHSTTPAVDFSHTQYSHNAYVDATPGTGDLYYNGAWHTWLVGGLGAGGNAGGMIGNNTSTGVGAIYALDITNPGNFSTANAASLVLGEWTSSTITCVGNTSCKNSLGSTYGTPIIRRLHDGKWAAIFGNGLNSASGKAGIFVMTVSPTDGSVTFRFLDTGSGTSSAKNGITSVTSADLDGDHVTDYVYAGDIQGNVWRFDLTSNTPGNWAVNSNPVFTTASGQPISTRVTVSSSPQKTGSPRVIIAFGTGQQLPQTLTSAATYATGTQSLYGIWDWNMAAWNALSTTKYASLASPQTVSTSNLVAQTATNIAVSNGSISGYRTVTQNAVCWKGSTACSSGNTKFGWSLALPTSTEQVIYNPVVAYGMFIVNTTVPAVTQALSCTAQPASGYTMAVALDSGGAPKTSFFADATNNYVAANGAIVSGLGLSATGTPSIVSAAKKPFLVQQTVSGVGVVTQINPAANANGGRVNWIKLR